MNNMGSVLKSCLSVHQQNCCYRLSSPSSTRFQKRPRAHSSQGLPQLVGTEEVVPVSSTGQPDAARKKKKGPGLALLGLSLCLHFSCQPAQSGNAEAAVVEERGDSFNKCGRVSTAHPPQSTGKDSRPSPWPQLHVTYILETRRQPRTRCFHKTKIK